MEQKPTLMMMVNSGSIGNSKNEGGGIGFDGKRSNVFIPTAKSELLDTNNLVESHRKVHAETGAKMQRAKSK